MKPKSTPQFQHIFSETSTIPRPQASVFKNLNFDGRDYLCDNLIRVKYKRLRDDLQSHGQGSMKVFGNSMLPIIKSGSQLTFRRQDKYSVGDIVFCKVRGRYIDAHIIKQVDGQGRYLIANNRGHENGWTTTVFGRVVL